MLSDSQVFIALFVALITGILAVRLGTQLYKSHGMGKAPFDVEYLGIDLL